MSRTFFSIEYFNTDEIEVSYKRLVRKVTASFHAQTCYSHIDKIDKIMARRIDKYEDIPCTIAQGCLQR